ncbi:MAG: hypothetical protein EA425_10850 [Puniceicoccaceae bacterium]|nr:MAG: hypothetical protein EA425_10850 [Puniceicoccaceae bacterium]
MGTLGYGLNFGTEPLAAPAMICLLLLVAWVALTRWLLPGWAFTRQEMITIAYILLIAAPVAGKAFWIPVVSLVAPHASRDQWQTYETLPTQFRPYGPNLVRDHLADPDRWTVEGGSVAVGEAVFARGRRSGPALVFSTTTTPQEETPTVRATIPLRLVEDGLYHNSYYIFTSLFRVTTEDPAAQWGAVLRPDSPLAPSLELVRGRGESSASFVQPEGFMRLGNFSFQLPAGLEETASIELFFTGVGRMEIADLELRDITAYILTQSGAPVITRSAYEELPPSYRAGVLVRPDNLLSPAGLKFLLTGTVLWGPWLGPMGWWLAFLFLLFGGAFSIGLILRRQWIDRERFPLPLTIPVVELVGAPQETGTGRRLPAIFSSGWFWSGVVLAAGFCLFDLLAGFNDGIAGPTTTIPIRTYLDSPEWGRTWVDINFRILPLAIGIGLLMELNVLISLVLGFLLFRLQFWMGHQTGWDTDGQYPYATSQGLGAFFFYGLTILVLARKYLWNSLRQAFRSERPASEPFGYRTSYAGLVLCAAGLFTWSMLLGSTVVGSLSLTVLGLIVALVYMKLRAECGVPGTSWFGGRILLFVPVVGGLGAIGPLAFGLNAELGRMLSAFSLLIVAGIQLEFLEMARRYGINRWHVPGAIAVALAGGVFIGGWFMLGGSYATGSENWKHSTMTHPAHTNVGETQRAVSQATSAMVADIPDSGIQPREIAFFAGGGVAVVLTVLRQLFAGFWFHPIGFLLGASGTLANVWGSLFLAWLVRLLVLRLGGAASVRERLRPAAVGLIAGTVIGYGVAILANSFVWSVSPGSNLFEPFFSSY